MGRGRGGAEDFRVPAAAPRDLAPRGGGLRPQGGIDGPVPFPPLPTEWGYGVSRRTGQYYFFQHGSKAPTTWKHPQTGEKYNTNNV